MHNDYINTIPTTAKYVEGNYESKPLNKAKVATITLYKITGIMAKMKKKKKKKKKKKNVQLWHLVNYLMVFKIKLKYAIHLKEAQF
jgi:hypothetical protein